MGYPNLFPPTPYIGGTWSWCLYPHSEDEIRERILTDYPNICFSYLVEHSDISDDFYEELCVLSLGRSTSRGGATEIKPFITKENYDQAYIPMRDTYRWVKKSFKGKPSVEGIRYTDLESSLYSAIYSRHLAGAEIRKEYEALLLAKEGHYKKNKRLEADLKILFTDRLPDKAYIDLIKANKTWGGK